MVFFPDSYPGIDMPGIYQFVVAVVKMFSNLYGWLNRPLTDVFTFAEGTIVGGILNSVTDTVLNQLGIGQYSLLWFMVGAGVVIYIAYQLATWILNIVT